jgi:hypothetical protein
VRGLRRGEQEERREDQKALVILVFVEAAPAAAALLDPARALLLLKGRASDGLPPVNLLRRRPSRLSKDGGGSIGTPPRNESPPGLKGLGPGGRGPAPGGRGGRSSASLTRSGRPLSVEPLSVEMHFGTEVSSANSTKAKPRGRPVSRSVGTLASTTLPTAEKRFDQLVARNVEAEVTDEDFLRNDRRSPIDLVGRSECSRKSAPSHWIAARSRSPCSWPPRRGSWCARSAPGPLRLELGGFENGLVSGAWERADRADLDAQATSDDVTSFYFRPSPPNAGLHLPIVAPGALRLTLRASARVRSGVSVFRNGARVDELLVQPRLWSRYTMELPADPRGPLELALALRPLPLVKGDHADAPRLLLDFVELESPLGLRSSWRPACAWRWCRCWCSPSPGAVSLGAARLARGRARRRRRRDAARARGAVRDVRRDPAAAAARARRGLAGVRGAAAAPPPLRAPRRGLLAALVALGTLLHGSLVFFPDHNPPDIDIHVRRTLDLGGVPLDYQALLRYGSQLPTASQDQGAATAALGERTLIPYSPLPYFFYYAFHLLGLDLYWAMTR